jgi:hypothetical protein
MKNGLFNTEFFWLNLLTPIVLLLPILIILLRKELRSKTMMPLVTLFAIFVVTSLLNDDLFGQHPSVKGWLVIAGFFLMGPLTLMSLGFFRKESPPRLRFRRSLWLTLLMFLVASTGMLISQGLDTMTGFMVVGTGIILVLIFYVPLFFHQIRVTIQKRTETGKAFMISAVVFSFGSFLLVYLMNLLLQDNVRLSDSFLLFNVIILLFSLLFSAGCLLYRLPAESQEAPTKKSKIPLLTEWEDM